MILNAYAVLDSFITLLRFLIAVLATGLAISAWRRWRGPATAEIKETLEQRSYLLFLFALLLLGLNLASWPLFYLLLQSYVPEWPGVMCIYGVTRIGTGTIGVSRFLPRLVTTLQITKPALIFAGGACFVLYQVNRRTHSAPLMRRIFLVMIGLGVLAGVDAGVEAAYLVIPKKEEFLAAGCCTPAFDAPGDPSRFLPAIVVEVKFHPWLFAAYYGINGGMALALLLYTLRLRSHPEVPRLGPLLLGNLLALLVSGLFLVEVGAPTLLHLPFHHCPYDLIPKVPEAVVGIGLFLWGTFAIGWACVVGWFADDPETRPFLPKVITTLLAMGLYSYLGSLGMMSMELALA